MNVSLTNHDFIEMEREYCSRSLHNYVRRAWSSIAPVDFIDNWHIGAISEHLEATIDGTIKRLLINVPPGTSKSTVTGILFPSYLWTAKKWPSCKIIGASHDQDLSIRDARAMRNLMESEWCKNLYNVQLCADQNEKKYFETIEGGFRQACPATSMTGRRGDYIIWDDPLSAKKADSEAHRQDVLLTLRETLPTRLTVPEKSVIIIIMQRLHHDDPSGYILSNDLGYEHLCIPMEFEPERRYYTCIGWTDPRQEDGELLMPSMFSKKVVDRLKQETSEYAYAGQMQQRPSPRGGGLIKAELIETVTTLPSDLIYCRGWDLAGAVNKHSDYTAGILMGRSMSTGKFYICDIIRGKYEPAEAEKVILNAAKRDTRNVKITIPKDPGQAGVYQAKSLANILAGYNFKLVKPEGTKAQRAAPFSSQVEHGNVCILQSSQNDLYLQELKDFDSGRNDDQVDATSDAFNELSLTPLGGIINYNAAY